jgi:hypothetical protein
MGTLRVGFIGYEQANGLEEDFGSKIALTAAREMVVSVRFVEGEKISTAGGLTSGTDLALRVVERYFGREAAQTTATCMEYQGKGWII